MYIHILYVCMQYRKKKKKKKRVGEHFCGLGGAYIFFGNFLDQGTVLAGWRTEWRTTSM